MDLHFYFYSFLGSTYLDLTSGRGVGLIRGACRVCPPIPGVGGAPPTVVPTANVGSDKAPDSPDSCY